MNLQYMKSLKDFIIESYSNGILYKSVKTLERKKVYNAIYDKLDNTKVTGHLYRDESWEGVKLVIKDVKDALKELNSKLNNGYQYEVSIAADNGGYRKSNDGMSQWIYCYFVYPHYSEDPLYTCYGAGWRGSEEKYEGPDENKFKETVVKILENHVHLKKK